MTPCRLRTTATSIFNHSSGRCGATVGRRHHRRAACYLQRRSFHNATFQEGDVLCIKRAKAVVDEMPLLTEPLKLQDTSQAEARYAFNCRHGVIRHRDLVGKKERDIVQTNKGTKMIVMWPTLEEYIILSKRSTTPIYPGDAQCIVGLLDLHVTSPSRSDTVITTADNTGPRSTDSEQPPSAGETTADSPTPSINSSDIASTSPPPTLSSDDSSAAEDVTNGSSKDGTIDAADSSASITSGATTSSSVPGDPLPSADSSYAAYVGSSRISSATENTPLKPSIDTSLASAPPTAPSTLAVAGYYSPMEILEVGTGHGSLTLHLARAIHASSNIGVDPTRPGTILHTVDVEKSTSNAAKKLLKNFRRGIYYTPESVKFSYEGCGPWLVGQLESRSGMKLPLELFERTTTGGGGGKKKNGGDNSKSEIKMYHIDNQLYRHPFLHAALIDLPFAEPYLPLLAAALHQGAFAGFFAPSITQLVRLITYSQVNRFPFFFERTVEFPNSVNEMGSNLREWDIRRVRMRKQEKEQVRDLRSVAGSSEPVPATSEINDEEAKDEDKDEGKEKPRKLVVPNMLDYEDDWMTVCRPLVGGKVRAGGFYAVARRMADSL